MTTSEQGAHALLEVLGAGLTVIRWTTPEDVTDHRARLLDHVRARPQQPYPYRFTYAPFDPAPVTGLCEQLRTAALSIREPSVRTAVAQRALTVAARVGAIAARDDQALTRVTAEQDGLPATATVAHAHTVLSSAPPDTATDTPTHTSDQVVGRLRAALDNYELTRWSVATDDQMAAGAVVHGGDRSVRVRADLSLSNRQVNRLVVHEIGGHVLRWENARTQPYVLAAVPISSGVATEEGLAALLEEQQGVSDPTQLRTYAARVIAVSTARHAGIMEVITALADGGVPLEEAVTIALRVKRGLADPNSAGGSTKDHCYLSGLLGLRELSADDVALLRSTKWAMEHLSLLQRLRKSGMLVPARLQPDLDRLGVTPTHQPHGEFGETGSAAGRPAIASGRYPDAGPGQ